ncbi:MAG TPA: class I SAM-dependent methyltransferase [Actinocatenispora sp.]
MTPETLRALLGEAGRAALAAAVPLAAGEPLAGVEALRRAGYPAELAAAAFGQARLRARAGAKLGPDAERMFLTTDGLQQATRAVVADRRARRLAASGVRTVLDLCCGIGADALAFARAGLRVTAVDTDPGTAAVAAANAETLGLSHLVDVRCADATTADRSGADAVFCDPARRSGGRRVFDPSAYSPPWDFLRGLADGTTCLKLGPGIDHALLPPGAEAEWVSVRGEVVEAALWCGPLARVPRRATVLDGAEAAELTGDGTREATVGPVRGYVYDPDGTVLRTHLLAELADEMDATIADPTIGYLYTDEPVPTPFARGYAVDEVLPFSVKRLRAALRSRGVGVVTIKKRGVGIDPDALRRTLKPAGDATATVVVTRVAGAPTALLCTPLGRAGKSAEPARPRG